jgi:hypothetical protein
MIYVGVKDRWWEKRKKLLFHETNTSRVNFRITRWLLHYSTSCGCHGIKIIELPQELKAIDRTQYYGYSKTVITSVSRGHDGPRSVFLPPGFIFMKENDSKSSGIPGIIFWGKTTTNHGHDTCIPTSHLRPVQCLLEWFWVPTLNMHVPGVKSIHCLAHLRWWAHMTATNGGIGTRRMGKSPPPPFDHALSLHSLHSCNLHPLAYRRESRCPFQGRNFFLRNRPKPHTQSEKFTSWRLPKPDRNHCAFHFSHSNQPQPQLVHLTNALIHMLLLGGGRLWTSLIQFRLCLLCLVHSNFLVRHIYESDVIVGQEVWYWDLEFVSNATLIEFIGKLVTMQLILTPNVGRKSKSPI